MALPCTITHLLENSAWVSYGCCCCRSLSAQLLSISSHRGWAYNTARCHGQQAILSFYSKQQV